MNYDIYYTIRKNKKEYHKIQTLFFGTKKIYDYKNIKKQLIFNSFEEALNYIYKNKLQHVHIRRHISTSSYYDHTDYMKGTGFIK